MAMPIDLVLVRHGESEGNIAQDMSKLNDDTLWEQSGFKARHTSKYRLTDLGRRQAQLAGEYLRENISEKYDRYYCSEYIRAMETAALLALEGAQWFCDFYLRERDKGLLGGISDLQRKEEAAYKAVMASQERDTFYWAPPCGESIASACLRVDRMLDILRTSCSGFKVIMVLHGNIMRAFRVRIERMSQRRFRELEESTNDKDKLWNCQIIHYTRRDPETGIVAPNFYWMRSICPWDTSLSSNEWQSIHRPTYSNEDLLAEVSLVPQLINNEDIPEKGRAATPDLMKKQSLLCIPNTENDAGSKEKENSLRASPNIVGDAGQSDSLLPIRPTCPRDTPRERLFLGFL